MRGAGYAQGPCGDRCKEGLTWAVVRICNKIPIENRLYFFIVKVIDLEHLFISYIKPS